MFWHSTAHVLGEAMERVYGGCLCYGPPIEEGFYYDMHLQDGQVGADAYQEHRGGPQEGRGPSGSEHSIVLYVNFSDCHW